MDAALWRNISFEDEAEIFLGVDLQILSSNAAEESGAPKG